MDRLEVHERIIATEYFLHGGVVDVPKVYDADGRYHTARVGKGQASAIPWRPGKDSVVVDKLSRSECRRWISELIAGA